MNRRLLRGLAPASTLFFTFTIARHAGAETLINGGNIGGQRWSPPGNPYFIRGDVTVPAGTTLTIDPGVIVEINNADLASAGDDPTRVEVVVMGNLIVSGTAGAVTFRARSGTGTGVWIGIRLVDASASPPAATATIDGAIFKNAQTAIQVWARSPMNFRGLTFEANVTGIETGPGGAILDEITATGNGIGVYLRGPGTLSRSNVSGSIRGTGLQGAGVEVYNLTTERVRIIDSTFDRSYFNVRVGAGVPEIVNCVLTNGQYGLYTSGGFSSAGVRVTNSTFDGNYYNIYNSTHRTDVVNSIVTNGHYGIVGYSEGLETAISYSDVWNNTTANLTLVTQGAGVLSVDPGYVSASDRHLQSSSPCIDSGIGPTVASTVPDHDLDVRPRPANGNGVVDADGSEYDMGAYEFPATGTGGMGGGGMGGMPGMGGGASGVGGAGGGAAGGAGIGGQSGGAGGQNGGSSNAGDAGTSGAGGANVGGMNGAGAGGLGGSGGNGGVALGGNAGASTGGGLGGAGNSAGATSGSGGASGGGGAAGLGGAPGSAGKHDGDGADESSCACRAVGTNGRKGPGDSLAVLLLVSLLARRKRGGSRSHSRLG